MKKRIRNILMVAFLVVYITPTIAATENGKTDTEKYLDRIADYITNNVANPSYGSVGGEWAVMGLARYGKISKGYIGIYKNNLRKKLEECNGNLSDRKYTEYARVTIALTSIGENPKNFYGYNLVKPLAELEHIKSQGANGIVYSLIALDCGAYSIPSPNSGYAGEVTTREKLISLILKAELSDGGWAYSGKVANADMTAMTIQALSPYYYRRKDVKRAVDKGVAALSDLQLDDGSFAAGKNKTCESTAQVLTALSEMHINISDKRFVKNGHTVIDGLLQYYKDGGFCHLPNGTVNQMATEQAMYAMVAYYRSITGKNRLYQMADEKKTIDNYVKKQQKNQKKKGDAGKKGTGKSKGSTGKNSFTKSGKDKNGLKDKSAGINNNLSGDNTGENNNLSGGNAGINNNSSSGRIGKNNNSSGDGTGKNNNFTDGRVTENNDTTDNRLIENSNSIEEGIMSDNAITMILYKWTPVIKKIFWLILLISIV